MVMLMMNQNNIIVYTLAGIAVLLISLSGIVLFADVEIAKDIMLDKTLAPLGIITAGLIGLLKSTS